MSLCEITSLINSFIYSMLAVRAGCLCPVNRQKNKLKFVIMNTLTKEIVMSSPALKHLSEIYPPNRYGKVPLKIKMACTVKSDLPIFIQTKPDMIAYEGQEYYVWCNSHGAMSAILPNSEKLGIRPSECEIVEWHS